MMRSLLSALFFQIALVGIVVPANASIYTLKVAASATQAEHYDQGIASVDSVQKITAVRVVNVPGSDKSSVSFVIGVLNRGDQPFNFGPENVTVRVSGIGSVALTTYEQVMEAERRKQKREGFWAGVAAVGRGLSATNAGTSYSNGTYSETANGFVNGQLVTAQASGIYSETRHDPAVQLAAQRQAQQLNAQDRAELQARWVARSAATNDLLRTTTVYRGRVYGGVATFPITAEMKKIKGPLEIIIDVTVGGEKHTIVGELAKSS